MFLQFKFMPFASVALTIPTGSQWIQIH